MIEGGRYSVGFAIVVAVDKYLDHMPLERQVRAMARAGLVIDAQTLFDQLWALHQLLLPAYVSVIAKFEGGQITKIEGRRAS